jgi:phospholipid/cholesterol/gamma-HCH transport system substrate-binding protein
MPSARQVRWAKFRTAVTVLAAAAILGAFIDLLTSGTLFQKKATLYLYMPDTGGVAADSLVRVDGTGVGKVRGVALSGSSDPGRIVKVTMTVEREHLPEIPSDSFAQISPDDLVGDQFVDVTSGKSPRPIRSEDEIVYKGAPELLKSLDLGQFEKTLRAVDAMLTDIEQGRSRVGQFVVGEQMYNDMRKRLSELQNGLRAATDATTKVGGLIYTDALYRKVIEPLRQFEEAFVRLQAGQGTAGRFLEDPAQFEELRHAVAGMRASVAGWRAGELTTSDAAYEAWNQSLASMIRAIDGFSAGPGFSSALWYDNLDGAARELRDALRDFHSNPGKFLRAKVF